MNGWIMLAVGKVGGCDPFSRSQRREVSDQCFVALIRKSVLQWFAQVHELSDGDGVDV
jgi:hypothetical protein